MFNTSHTKDGVVFLGVLVFLGIVSLIPAIIGFATPGDISFNKRVIIEDGSSLNKIARQLEQGGIVKSAAMFRIALILSGKARSVQSGTYIFERPQSLFSTAYRVVNGTFGAPPIQVVVFEGDTITNIAGRFAERLDNFDRDRFIELAKNYEGYLFPDTYTLFPDDDEEVAFNLMREAFNEKVGTDTPRDIITMASIVEREAPSNMRDKRLIAGILWKRIKRGMPLQVDAPFHYSFGKYSLELTTEDLEKDSPYNTYTNLGLPPTPISNPGLDAIGAARNPLDSEYWFFLSDKGGNMHYAATFKQHKANKARYIR